MSGLLMKRHKSIFIMWAHKLVNVNSSIQYVKFRSYTERLKAYRRLMQLDFNPREATKYWELQEHEAHILLKSLLDTPENVFEHIRR